MKIKYVVIENKTKLRLWVYYKGVGSDYLHVAVTIDPAQAPTLAKHEKYLILPNRLISIPLKRWPGFQGIKFDISRIRDVWLSTEQTTKPSEGSHYVIIKEKLN